MNLLKHAIRSLARSAGYDFVRRGTDTCAVPFGKMSFSQCGEDRIIRYIFDLRGVAKPSYLDIGANQPFYISNTASLYRDGSTGIVVDANPRLIESFRSARPRDIALNVGVADVAGELDFYVMEDDTLSTFSKEECDLLVSHGKPLRNVERIPVTTIKAILDAHHGGRFPDLLSLDVEGLDLAILRTIDFAHDCPKVICVEAAAYSPTGAGARNSELIDFLASHDYYEYANTNLNAIMVRRDFWFP
jgi:FkbM family methyltransferase